MSKASGGRAPRGDGAELRGQMRRGRGRAGSVTDGGAYRGSCVVKLMSVSDKLVSSLEQTAKTNALSQSLAM